VLGGWRIFEMELWDGEAVDATIQASGRCGSSKDRVQARTPRRAEG
jgi:hypothetical protein